MPGIEDFGKRARRATTEKRARGHGQGQEDAESRETREAQERATMRGGEESESEETQDLRQRPDDER